MSGLMLLQLDGFVLFVDKLYLVSAETLKPTRILHKAHKDADSSAKRRLKYGRSTPP